MGDQNDEHARQSGLRPQSSHAAASPRPGVFASVRVPRARFNYMTRRPGCTTRVDRPSPPRCPQNDASKAGPARVTVVTSALRLVLRAACSHWQARLPRRCAACRSRASRHHLGMLVTRKPPLASAGAALRFLVVA